MTHHAFDTTTLILSLTSSELSRAARLGGLPMALDEQDINDPATSIELVRFFAKRGIKTALHETYERQFPARYPEDVDPSYWQANPEPLPIDGRLNHGWRGKVSW